MCVTRALWTYCPQLTTHHKRTTTVLSLQWSRGCLQIGSDRQEDLATPGFVQWRQTLANRTLALHLPGGRQQLFGMTVGALWTQQRSSGVCYKRRKEVFKCRVLTHHKRSDGPHCQVGLIRCMQVILDGALPNVDSETGIQVVWAYVQCLNHWACSWRTYMLAQL